MIQRLLHAKNLIACILAAATGMTLYLKAPFPANNFFLELIFLWSPRVFLGFEYCYYLFLYTTPYIVYSVLLSGVYIFALKFKRQIRPGTLPPYPAFQDRAAPSLVVGEVHNPRKLGPAEAPHWLTIPERGLFTGIAIFGAVGSGHRVDSQTSISLPSPSSASPGATTTSLPPTETVSPPTTPQPCSHRL